MLFKNHRKDPVCVAWQFCFKKHNVIYKNQYGFQSNISTSHAMLDVVTSSYDNIDDHSYTRLAFVDLKKAFDAVSHNILLTKLNNCSIQGVAQL